MNKKDFITELVEKTGLTEDKCKKINNILEDTNIIGKKNKDKILKKISKELKISETEAEKIYEAVASILLKGIKAKLNNLFKSIKNKKSK